MIKKLFVLVLLSAVALFVFQNFKVDDRTQIRTKLNSMVDLASVYRAMSVLEVGSRAQTVSEYFAPKAVIEIAQAGAGKRRIEGRKEIHDSVITLSARTKPIELRLLDVKINIAPGKTHAAAETSLQVREAGAEHVDVFEFKFNFEKFDKEWLITSVETLETPNQK